ncbi:MAG TPA: endolytic transglycosylase MltG [Bacteroidales bacterium]|nr:endolytic transglycosylase MltG [Bacteroidales bacterium]HPI87215.1 endolytic transglycosylase MltG [Bacteroidales bacterium]
MAVQIRKPEPRKKRGKFHRIILLILAGAVVISLVAAWSLFNMILKPNVTVPGGKASLYIPSGSTYQDVKGILKSNAWLRNSSSFEWMAQRKNYPARVKPGHYIIHNGMSNNSLVNMLRSGVQTPVDVTFNNILNKEELAGKIAGQIEADSLSLIECWNDKEFLKSLNTNPAKVIMLFLPDTYELWWTTSAREFTQRMAKESDRFWNEERLKKGRDARMSREEVIILASIIEKETQMNDEKPVMAGVYINRLKKGWPLQADPTVKFALGRLDLKRVLKIHTEFDSPYNTYKYTGLPPGPICIPSKASIEAVLNFRKHDYMFFCAKADMSGYHVFSRTLAEHNRYAAAYQAELNRRRIR